MLYFIGHSSLFSNSVLFLWCRIQKEERMFSGGSAFGSAGGSTFGGFGQPKPVGQTMGLTTQPSPPDIEVVSPPEDSVSCLSFSPPATPNIFLIAGSWDNNVRLVRNLPLYVLGGVCFLYWLIHLIDDLYRWDAGRSSGQLVKPSQRLCSPCKVLFWMFVGAM